MSIVLLISKIIFPAVRVARSQSNCFSILKEKFELKQNLALDSMHRQPLKPEEFPDKMNFKKFVIGRVLREFSKLIDK